MSRQARAELLRISCDLEALVFEAQEQAEYLRLSGTPGFSLDAACNGMDALAMQASIPLPLDPYNAGLAKCLTALRNSLAGTYNAVLNSPETGESLLDIAERLDYQICLAATLASTVEQNMVASIPR